MNGIVSKNQIEYSLSSVWDLGNETLYRRCNRIIFLLSLEYIDRRLKFQKGEIKMAMR